MRLIVLSLFLLNIAAFFYFKVFAVASSDEFKVVNVSDTIGHEQNIKLLSEFEGIEKNDIEVDSDATREIAGAEEKLIENVLFAEPLCTLVGSFERLLKAEYFIERLQTAGLNAEVKNVVVESEPGYWLHLQPETSRKDALRKLSELQRRGIDSYVIPSGNLENGVSLGMFSNKSLADSMFAKVKQLGYLPKIAMVPREQKEIWAFLPAGEASKLSDKSWADLLSSEEYIQKRQNVCSDLASY